MNKKCFFVFVFVSVFLSFVSVGLCAQEGEWSDVAATEWFTGHADQKDFVIANGNELAGLASLVNLGGHTFEDTTFILSADIDLGERYWTPIGGRDINSDAVFRGAFSGNRKVIKNLHIQEKRYSGLFGYVGGGTRIEHITLEGGKIVGKTRGSNQLSYIGSLIGMGECSGQDSIILRNCHSRDIEIIASQTEESRCYTGGIIGYISSDKGSLISGCSNSSLLYNNFDSEWRYPSYHISGGIAGYASGTNLSFCRNSGDVHFTSIDIGGGIVGRFELWREHAASISSCYNDGLIRTYYRAVSGGLIGRIVCNDGSECRLTISNCYSIAIASTETRTTILAGGLIGTVGNEYYDTTPVNIAIENSYFLRNKEHSGFVSYDPMGGGLTGLCRDSNRLSISNSLVVIASPPRPAYPLAYESGADAIYSGNYTYINGNPVGEDDADGPLGGEWKGGMDEAVFNHWDTDIWEIDNTNRYMPALKGFDNQSKIPNPLYMASQAYHTVTLPEVEGVDIDYPAGTYRVREGSDFAFSITPKYGYEVENMEVTDQDGKAITRQGGFYVIEKISKDTHIRVEGVTIGNETVTNESAKVWTSDGRLHITTTSEQPVSIYNLHGQLLAKKTINGVETISLPRGLYIVYVGNMGWKVVV